MHGRDAPFDHPHIFIDIGGDTEAICPYCSTRFVFDAALGAHCRPKTASGGKAA